MPKLEGLIAAPFTPVDTTGKVNLSMINKYADHLINAGLTGAFILGTTGEGSSFSKEERMQVAEEWIACSYGKLKIIVHVGGNCLSECIELARHAESVGAFATAALSPYFFRPDTAERLVSFMKPVAAGNPGIPFYYYHMPSMTGISIKASDFVKITVREIPNFGGVKYTHSDLMDMQECLSITKDNYDILNGYDEHLICGLSLGIKSAVGSTYNYMASLYLNLWKAYDRYDMEEARRLQQLSVNIVKILNRYGGGVKAGKAIMSHIGIDCGQCRLPVSHMDDNEKAALGRELVETGFFDFADLVR